MFCTISAFILLGDWRVGENNHECQVIGNEVVGVVEDPTKKWVQCLLQKAIMYADFLSVREAVKEVQKEITFSKV